MTTSELDATSGEEDSAGIFELSATYTPFKTDKSEIELGYDFYQSLYADLSDFDLQLHTLYGYGSHEFDQFDLGGAYRFTHASLGGDSFFDIHSMRPNIGFSSSEKLFHTLAYNYQYKDFDSDDDRDAHNHALSFDSYYFLGSGGTYILASIKIDDENTDGDQFDYQGYYLNLGASGQITPFAERPTRVRFGYQYYSRDYDSITPSIGRDREDQRHAVSLSFKQPLSDCFAAILDYQYISADSNLPTSDYNENIVSLSLEFSL